MHHTEPQQPFFARFLEAHYKQETTNSNEQLVDPWPIPLPTSPFKDAMTDKWPSDYDEV